MLEREDLRGTDISNYLVCKRKAYLSRQGITMENRSELVKIGKVMHEQSSHKKKEVKIDNIVIDRITKDYVVETKKSDSNVESARFQLLYYLYKLKLKGVDKKGMLEFKEYADKARVYVELDSLNEEKLTALLDEIIEYLNGSEIEKYNKIKECAMCSYNTYCMI